MNKTVLNNISMLLDFRSPCGDCNFFCNFLKSEFNELGFSTLRDSTSYLLIKKEGNGSSKLHINVPIDEPSIMITDRREDGLMSFSVIGKVDTSSLLGKKVMVGGKKKYPGVITCSSPLHLRKKEDDEYLTKSSEMLIDASMNNNKEDRILPCDYGYIGTEKPFISGNKIFAPTATVKAVIAVLMSPDLYSGCLPEIYISFSKNRSVGVNTIQMVNKLIRPDITLSFLPACDNVENDVSVVISDNTFILSKKEIDRLKTIIGTDIVGFTVRNSDAVSGHTACAFDASDKLTNIPILIKYVNAFPFEIIDISLIDKIAKTIEKIIKGIYYDN